MSASETTPECLARPPLKLKDTKKLQLNFDPVLASNLKESRYFTLILPQLPDVITDIYSKNDNLRQLRIQCGNIANTYNFVISNAMNVELALIQNEINTFDAAINPLLTTKTWETAEMTEVSVSVEKIKELKNRLVKAQENLAAIENKLSPFTQTPMIIRRDKKNDTTLPLDERATIAENRYKVIDAISQMTASHMQANLALFKADYNSTLWQAYEEHVDDMVNEYMTDTIFCSLDYLVNNTEEGKRTNPLIETKLILKDSKLIFQPGMTLEEPHNLMELIDNVISDTLKQAQYMRRVKHADPLPFNEVIQTYELINNLTSGLSRNISQAMAAATEVRLGLHEEFHFFWTLKFKDCLDNFVKYGTTEVSKEQLEYMPEIPPTLDQFRTTIHLYESYHEKAEALEDFMVMMGWLRIDLRPFKQMLQKIIKQWSQAFKKYLSEKVSSKCFSLKQFIADSTKELSVKVEDLDRPDLIKVLQVLKQIRDHSEEIDGMFDPLKEIIFLLRELEEEPNEETMQLLEQLPDSWVELKNLEVVQKQNVQPLQEKEVKDIMTKSLELEQEANTFLNQFQQSDLFKFECKNAYQKFDKWSADMRQLEKSIQNLTVSAQIFDVRDMPVYQQMKVMSRNMFILKILWDYIFMVGDFIESWKVEKWNAINFSAIDNVIREVNMYLRSMDKEVKRWPLFQSLEALMKETNAAVQAVRELQNPAIKERHWIELMRATKADIQINSQTTFADLLSLNLHKFEEEVHSIVFKATNEQIIERELERFSGIWNNLCFEYAPHDRTKLVLPKATDDLTSTLEESQVKVLDMLNNRDNGFFFDKIQHWHQCLSVTDQVISLWFEVQRIWSGLESIFILCDDIKVKLPKETENFFKIQESFFEVAKIFEVNTNVVKACSHRPTMVKDIEHIRGGLSLCEKALADYLETKRLAFPRFYFVSVVDLMDIVSNGKMVEKVMKHLSKLFDSINKLQFVDERASEKSAKALWAKDGEFLKLSKPFKLKGQVEEWLNALLQSMIATLRTLLEEAVITYEEKPREQWIMDFPAQISLTASQIHWALEVNIAFARLEEGLEHAMKEYNKKQINQLGLLIQMLLNDLTRDQRQKIMTICTIDVHNRDIVAKLVDQKADNNQSFTWLSQLRHRWSDKDKDCFANICDAQFRFAYEYLGNQPRLVITPLTDRCYITLTQSLHLCMSGAPAGPAGTGKTETTKDLGRALGVMVYVFNCSEQMDYKSVGNIYKGLAQSGSWGCFDEFNRISVEVLSVVAVQVKSIQDAIKMKKPRFDFLGENISLDTAVGLFITMNPGYAGRTELPENLKALFRPCAMVVPDFELICEIMLVAEGFLDARLLARKFITLYQLCKELLSKQDHYDWGLRAIKSVLVVAGTLKRADKTLPEMKVLMRALRDFNTPKIVSDDTPIFLGLIGDLFPAIKVPRQRNLEFEKKIKAATENLGLQPEDNFILKIVQLQELFDVRHSVFIVGNSGSGKSEVWKALHHTFVMQKAKPIAVDLDPKAVTNDELFGIINPSTREWKDGLFSVVMRDLANITHDGPKWIVLDGDIDPMWIESLNTVMDDNKILTLASNERIPLTASMRLLFEISHLRTATPATVSRAGILYLNPSDLGWQPFVNSWLDKRAKANPNVSRIERGSLSICFDKYVPLCLEMVRSKFKKITPIMDISHVQTLCHFMDSLLQKSSSKGPEWSKENYETVFVFACIWAFGGCLFKDQLTDHRLEFAKWWVAEFKQIKMPSKGTVFDYYLDVGHFKFRPWTDKITKFELDPEVPLQASIVPTGEVARISYFLDLLIQAAKPVMLIGSAGTGKSVLLEDKFSNLPDEYMVKNVPFNYYTTSEMLQMVLEKSIEKKAGKNYGPPGQKRLIYFVDDLNMPEVDKYFTVQPHTLMRQHVDYKHWYDRQKLTLKIVHNTQYVAAMNPTAGSFTITPRLQRHFTVFALSFPDDETVKFIYSNILKQHLSANKFAPTVIRMTETLIDAMCNVHNKVASTFLPTAIKFHYIFNLRDLSNIFQSMLFLTPQQTPTPKDLILAARHEMERVYTDKMVDQEDIETYKRLSRSFITIAFTDQNENELFIDPLIFSHFAKGLQNKGYCQISNMNSMSTILNEALQNYNESQAVMNLVLFGDAIQHVIRINRILEMPRGNALLIGIGGSGKQSLSKLAAFISGMDVSQIVLRKGYNMGDLKADLSQFYIRAGLKSMPVVFLMTDAQVAEEQFLIYINDFLASGEIPDLFDDETLDTVIQGVRPEVKMYGIIDTNENCWKFFISKVRRAMRVILCFSPVGNTIRLRARRFPALVNCTCIDWFHEWPHEALLSVSRSFLEDATLLQPELKDSISEFMAFCHSSVNDQSKLYFEQSRRYNYTTPKSFLEQIELYKRLLIIKDEELKLKIQRLVNGLERLRSAASQTEGLKMQLAEQEVVVNEKAAAANELIVVVGAEAEKVGAEKEVAATEETKVAAIKKEVAKKARECEADLRRAEPALVAAQEALNTLNKANLSELKALATPPPDIALVGAAVMVLLAMDGRLPRDRSWKATKAGPFGKVDTLLSRLINYEKEKIHPSSKAAAMEYVRLPNFDVEAIRNKSLAAAGLCAWVINICKFHDVFLEVKPKRDALDEANQELNDATTKLENLQAKVRKLEASLAKLTAQYQAATDEKTRCQNEAEFTAKTLDLANRLVSGFASENVRWAHEVDELKILGSTLPGDVLLTTSFISYLGYFTKSFRIELMDNLWRNFLKQQKVVIPIREGIDPLNMLIDDAVIASWSNESLPSDRMSIENATIFSFSGRWPLVIDPQLQAIKWIKKKYGTQLQVVRLYQRGYMDVIEKAISEGTPVLIENIGESLDAVLDPVIGRVTVKKGRYMKIGDKEVPFNPTFRLMLHTKLGNPHYKPEMQAQTTLINFTVTRDGLEEQLLAGVVSKERPDLETVKSNLTKQQNEFKITLKNLEDSLLAKLASSDGNFLGDHSLVENLETNKRTAKEIEEKVAEAHITEKEINKARDHYRTAACRAALLYFIMNDLYRIHPMYQFSLKAFASVFDHAIDSTPEADDEKARLDNLISTITFSIFTYTTRSLFEHDKLIFTMLMATQILMLDKRIEPVLLDFLLRYPALPDLKSPVDFLSDLSWGGVKALVRMPNFRDLDRDMLGSVKRWKTFVECECPEKEKFPQEWKNKSLIEQLCIMRALRADRMIYALRNFVAIELGSKYVEGRSVEFSRSFSESSPSGPIFFILSPGVDPLKDVEVLGKKLQFSMEKGNFHNISLGQGQEVVAEQAMAVGQKEGHWVVLQNVHLVMKWLPTLEKLLEMYSENSNENYRVFISAEPAASADSHIIPQGILENAIKITNEPPTGMMANLHKALDNFSQETMERCTKEAEFKPIVFALCYFHAVVTERRKFGAQGWNRVYPFNNGDLTICVDVLYNYLEANPKIPWEDLRYLFGEIMYGGHITDDWDRRLCRTYLEEYMQAELIDGDLLLAIGFPSPPNSDYNGYHQYIDEALPPESPYLYGLHPNAEIDFLTMRSERVFRLVLEMQPHDAGAGGGDGMSKEETIRTILDDLMDRLPDGFILKELQAKQPPEERTPYTVVVLQECYRMNLLITEIRKSLKELLLGLKGELTISLEMEMLGIALFLDQVPETWERHAYPSLYPLGLWFADMISRIKDLDAWTQDFGLPGSVWLGGLFNPQSFLTAVMQQTARKNEWPLDRMLINCDVTKKVREDMGMAPREGAFVHGLFMEGARWDAQSGSITEARLKELAPMMPVIFLKAIPVDRQELRGTYECPVYKTKFRGPTFVWTLNIKTKERPSKWILGGVALLLQI